ncbi:MAG: hypothetical protein Ct9H300mP20_02470 [Gammaproteobacteria bacterium]|nr:MAG: hypothetical protein Ct9H300mP20_02470 [Gammaproteobacteria bacterium]
MNEKNTLFNWFKLVLKRDLVLSFKKIATFMVPLVFFLIVITLFPLALGTEGSFLSTFFFRGNLGSSLTGFFVRE